MEDGLIMIIVLFGLGILCAIALGIGAIIAEIQDKIEKKRREKLIKEYPELKELLAEYMRTQNNVGYTASEIYTLKEEINKQIEENKYLPKGDRVDAYIETLKEKYKWLDELRENQSIERDLAYKKLELFWETNFPDLKEEKRIMWWYW
jgi:regulator of replication initiation timing